MSLLDYPLQMWVLARAGQTRGVLFFVCLYALAVLSYSFVRQRMTARWPSTVGRLEGAAVERFGGPEASLSDQEYVAGARYRYEVDGEEHVGTRVSPWVVVASHNARFVLARQLDALERLPDGGVRVFYDPRRPARSFLVKPGVFGQVVTLVGAVMPMAAYLWRYHG